MILIFNGPPGSGKDAICYYLEEKFNFENVSFKKTLFDEVLLYYNVDRQWFIDGYLDRDAKENKKESLLNGLTRREAMIHVSEDICKPKYGKDYFSIGVSKEINSDLNKDYCFSDGGFLEEFGAVININGKERVKIIQLFRNNCDFSRDSRRYINGQLKEEFVIGEKSVTDKNQFIKESLDCDMYRVYNNGSLVELFSVIDYIYKRAKKDERKSSKG
jgi:hypothetical protein